MKKILLLIITCIFIFPILVSAEVCQKDDIVISKIELNEVRGNAEETDNPNSNNNQINLNTKMNVIGDSLTYKIVIKNTSNSDYVFDRNQITKDYINYDISYEDNSNIVKSGEEKTIYLRLRYDSKPQADNLSNGIFQGTNQVTFDLKNNQLINPLTGNKNILFLIILSIVIIVASKIFKTKKTYLIVVPILFYPLIVEATCICKLDINLNLEIDVKEAVFLPGKEVNIKMKQLAGDDTSTVTNGYSFQDQLITSIKYSETEPNNTNKAEENIVSTTESLYPIYMWYEDGTIYWWSEDKTPSLNEDASYMFNYFKELKNISGIKNIDASNAKYINSILFYTSVEDLNDFSKWETSNVENMELAFSSNKIKNISGIEHLNTSNVSNMDSILAYNRELETIEGLEIWDVSKVEDMSGMFMMDISLKEFNPIRNWDVRKVKSMDFMFATCFSVEEIDLSEWETNSLENMRYMFAQLWITIDGESVTGGTLKRIKLSEKFDTSKVDNMDEVFYNNRVIEDYSFLKYIDTSNVKSLNHIFFSNDNLKNTDYLKDWDVSKVENMNGTFIGTSSLESLEGLKNWDTSSVTEMTYMFRKSYALSSLKGLENWNVSKVNSFNYMFDGISNLEETNYINNWNIQKEASFTGMFKGALTHPDFSKVNGTWSNGTFTPTE